MSPYRRGQPGIAPWLIDRTMLGPDWCGREADLAAFCRALSARLPGALEAQPVIGRRGAGAVRSAIIRGSGAWVWAVQWSRLRQPDCWLED